MSFSLSRRPVAMTGHLHAAVQQQAWHDNAGKNGRAAVWSRKLQLSFVGVLAASCLGFLLYLVFHWVSGPAVPRVSLVAIGMSDYKQLSPHNCGKADAAFMNMVFGHLHERQRETVAPATSVAGRLGKGQDLYDVIGSALQPSTRSDDENMVSILYVSGHAVPLYGASDGSGTDIGLLALDTTAKNLREKATDVSAYISLTDICKLIQASKARTVLLAMDVDHPLTDWKTGILGDDVVALFKEMSTREDSLLRELLQSGKLVIICSRDVDQKSWPFFEEHWEKSRKKNFSIDTVSAFAYYLGEALSGAADGNLDAVDADGRVTVGEICHYMKQNVKRWSEDHRAAAQTVLVFPEKVNPRKTGGNLWANVVLKTGRGEVDNPFLAEWATNPPDNYEKWRESQQLASDDSANNNKTNSPRQRDAVPEGRPAGRAKTSSAKTSAADAKKRAKTGTAKGTADEEESIEEKIDNLWTLALNSDDGPLGPAAYVQKQSDIDRIRHLEHLLEYGMETHDQVAMFLAGADNELPQSPPPETTLPVLAFQVCRKTSPTEESKTLYEQLLNGVSAASPTAGEGAEPSAGGNNNSPPPNPQPLQGLKVDDPAEFGRWLIHEAANATEPARFNSIHNAIVSQWEGKNKTPPFELVMLKTATRYYGGQASYETMTAASIVMKTWDKYLTVVSEVARSTRTDHFQLIQQDLEEATKNIVDGTRWLSAAAAMPRSVEFKPLEENALKRFSRAESALDKCNSILEEVASSQRLYRSTVVRFPSYALWVACAAEQWKGSDECDSRKLKALVETLKQEHAALLMSEDVTTRDDLLDFRTKSDVRMLKYHQLEGQLFKMFFRVLNLRRALMGYTAGPSGATFETLGRLKTAKDELAECVAEFEQTIRRPTTTNVSSNDYYAVLESLVVMPRAHETRAELRTLLHEVPRPTDFSSPSAGSRNPDRSGVWRALYGMFALRLQAAARERETGEQKSAHDKLVRDWLELYDASASPEPSRNWARALDRFGSELANEFAIIDRVNPASNGSDGTETGQMEPELMANLSQYWFADHHLDDHAIVGQLRMKLPQDRHVEWPDISEVKASVNHDRAGDVSLKITWPERFEREGEFVARVYGFPQTSGSLSKNVDRSRPAELLPFELREPLKEAAPGIAVLTTRDDEFLCHFAPVVLLTPFDPNAWNIVFRNHEGQKVRGERTSGNVFKMLLPVGELFELSAFLDVPETDTATKLVKAQLFACDDRSTIRERQPLSEPLEIQIGNKDQMNEQGEYKLNFVPRQPAAPAADGSQAAQPISLDISNGFAVRLTPMTGATLEQREANVDVVIKCDYHPWTQWLKDPELTLQRGNNKSDRIIFHVAPQPVPAQEKETVLLTPERVLVELDDRKLSHLSLLAKRADLKLGEPGYDLILLVKPGDEHDHDEFDFSLTVANIPHACSWHFDADDSNKNPQYTLKEGVSISRAGTTDAGPIVVTSPEGAFEDLPLEMSIFANKRFKGERLELKWFVEPYPIGDSQDEGGPQYVGSKILNGPYEWKPSLSLAAENKWTFQGTLSDFRTSIERGELEQLSGRYRLVCEVQGPIANLRDEKTLIVDNSKPEIRKFDFVTAKKGVWTWNETLRVNASAKDDDSGISRMRLILDKNGDGQFLDDDLTAAGIVPASDTAELEQTIEMDLSELTERPGEYGIALEIENGAGLPQLSSIQKVKIQPPASGSPGGGDGKAGEKKGTLILAFDRSATIEYQLKGPPGFEPVESEYKLVTEARNFGEVPAGKYVLTWSHSSREKPDVKFEVKPGEAKKVTVRVR